MLTTIGDILDVLQNKTIHMKGCSRCKRLLSTNIASLDFNENFKPSLEFNVHVWKNVIFPGRWIKFLSNREGFPINPYVFL